MFTLPKKWALLPFTFLQTVGFSAILFLVPQLAIYKVCLTSFNSTICNQLGQPQFRMHENYVFKRAAAWVGLINFAGYFPALIIALPLGAMTDLVSKKKMLLLTAGISLVASLINLLSSIFITLHVGFLALANFMLALYGEFPGFVSLCCAYGAMSSSSKDRTLVISFINASVRVGVGLGGLTVNYLKRYYGFNVTFLFIAAILVVNLLYTLVLIPLTDEGNKKSIEGEQEHFWDGFKKHTKDTWQHIISFIRNRVFGAKNLTFLLLLIASFLTLSTNGGERALIVLFLEHSPLNVKADKIGLYIVLSQCTRGVGLVTLSLIADRCLRLSDNSLMLFGTVSLIIHYTVLSFSKTMLMVYLSTVFLIPGSFLVTAVRSKVSKLVSPDEVGTSQSLIGLGNVLGVLIVSVTANGLFIATVKIYSGFSILLMSIICTLTLAILCCVYCTKEQEEANTDDYQTVATEEDKISQE